MNLDFRPVSLEQAGEYRRLLAATPQQGSDYSFINVWGWRDIYGLEWAFHGGLCWLRQQRPEPLLWAPVGPWSAVDWPALAGCLGGRAVIRVPEKLAGIWQQALRPTLGEARGHWDYLYAVADLVTLEGPRFHKKRELLERFRAAYAHEFHELTADCVESALDMQAEWCRWRDCEDSGALVAENDAIRRVLEGWDRLPGLLGGALRVEGRIIAYTVAEALSADTLVIHFEKAHTAFEGAYQAINQMFLAHAGAGYAFVNREQDLDEPGLRKAKLSYNPVGFLRKYTARF